MKTIYLVAFCFLPFFALIQTKEKLLAHTYILYDSGRNELALIEINKLITEDSTAAPLFDLRAGIQLKLENFRQAAEDFTTAILLSPQDPYYYHHRAILFYNIQQPNLAIKDNNEALKYVSGNDSLKYSIINNRGNAKSMKRDFQSAYKDYM